MSADAPWEPELSQAVERAKNENKLLLIDFTGSDWCGWCKKLDAETFSKSEFIEYASNNLVLYQADFPHAKMQSADVKRVNQALAQKFDAHGFPTLVALKPDGTVLWKQVGYMEGGPAALIQQMEKIKFALGNPNTPPVAAKPATASLPPGFIVAKTEPKPGARPSGGEPKLQAILYSSHPCATFDGQPCEVGDSVHGMKILSIQRRSVTVQWNGRTEELRLN